MQKFPECTKNDEKYSKMLPPDPMLSIVWQNVIQVNDSSWVQVEVSWLDFSWRHGCFFRFSPLGELPLGEAVPRGDVMSAGRGVASSAESSHISGCHGMLAATDGHYWSLLVTIHNLSKISEVLWVADAQPIWHPHYFGRQAFHADHCLNCRLTSPGMGCRNLQTFPKGVHICARSAWNKLGIDPIRLRWLL